jgi:hypothetical protein
MRHLLALLLMSSSASAHDWFTAQNDPVTGRRCCGGTDCATVPQEMIDSGAVTPIKDGFYVNLTVDQAKHFNKSATKSVSKHIFWTRVLPDQSKDPNGTGYALCIVSDEVQCFFARQGY